MHQWATKKIYIPKGYHKTPGKEDLHTRTHKRGFCHLPRKLGLWLSLWPNGQYRGPNRFHSKMWVHCLWLLIQKSAFPRKCRKLWLGSFCVECTLERFCNGKCRERSWQLDRLAWLAGKDIRDRSHLRKKLSFEDILQQFSRRLLVYSKRLRCGSPLFWWCSR